MLQSLMIFLALLLVLGFPSANLQWLDGLPFSRLYEFAALALLVPFLIIPDLRKAQSDLWKRWKIRPMYLWIAVAAILLLKGALLASGVHDGFTGCYRSPAAPTSITHEDLPPRECERSYENLFDRFSATRLDASLWFQPDTWNLVFLNTNRYDYYDWETGNILRERIPLAASWSGTPAVKPGETIRIEYVGEGTVAWGAMKILLPPSYHASNVVEMVAPPGENSLRIDYTFDDGSRSGQDPQTWGPRATMEISAGTPGRMAPLTAANPALGWRLAAMLADALILLLLFSFIPALWNAVRSDLAALAVFCLGVGLFIFLPSAPLIREFGIIAVLAAFLVYHLAVRPFRPATIFIAVLAAAFAILHIWSTNWGEVLLRSAGNDPLTYESQAYSILVTRSLEGGEAVFYQQPMFRYVLFVGHVLFGDGNMPYFIVQLTAFFGGVFWLLRLAGKRLPSRIPSILIIGLGCSLIFLGGYYVSTVIRNGLSESPTWIFLLWALPGLFWELGAVAILSGSAALAISYTIRSNQIPGILWILFLAFIGNWKKNRRAVLLAGVLACLLALLPLAHNLFFGHQWVLVSSSGNLAVNLTVRPSTWLAFLKGDPSAGNVIREQIGMMFLIADVPRSMLPTLAAMAFCLVVWVLIVIQSILNRAKRLWTWLVIPLAYLAPHFFYVINNYYPRHIFIAYLSMAIVGILALIPNRSDVPAEVEPAVELPR